MDRISLSIIIPMYNAEKFIERCVKSIIPSLNPKVELIVVNDGSKDRSYELCSSFLKEYSNARVINQENCGSVAARRNGVRSARGKYITFVDADDYVSEGYIEAALENIDDNIDVVIFGMTFVRYNHSFQVMQELPEGEYSGENLKNKLLKKMLCCSESPYKFGISPSVCGEIIRRTLIEDAFDDAPIGVTLGEDALITYFCLAKSNKVKVLDQAGYNYVENIESMTHRYDPRLINSSIALGESMTRIFEPLGLDGIAQVGSYMRYITLKVLANEFHKSGKPFNEAKKCCREYLSNEWIRKSLALESRADINLLGLLYRFLLRHRLFGLIYLYSKLHPAI